jgi:hypothetical protein
MRAVARSSYAEDSVGVGSARNRSRARARGAPLRCHRVGPHTVASSWSGWSMEEGGEGGQGPVADLPIGRARAAAVPNPGSKPLIPLYFPPKIEDLASLFLF